MELRVGSGFKSFVKDPEDKGRFLRRKQGRLGEFSLISEKRKRIEEMTEDSSRAQEVAQEGRELCPEERKWEASLEDPGGYRAPYHPARTGRRWNPSWALALLQMSLPQQQRGGPVSTSPCLARLVATTAAQASKIHTDLLRQYILYWPSHSHLSPRAIRLRGGQSPMAGKLHTWEGGGTEWQSSWHFCHFIIFMALSPVLCLLIRWPVSR